MSALHVVVMAGGSGTRFWPASRSRRPKQFLPLARGEVLLAATLGRVRDLADQAHTWIVTNAAQAAAIPALLPGFPAAQVVVEPEARDTAPCVALATATIAARDPDATIVVMPADHVIEPAAAFVELLRRGAAIAADRRSLVTFGIRPDHPATGYGYIECGERADTALPAAFAARRFREKPDLATATSFLAAGGFLWNSGIFVWTAAAIRAAMLQCEPALGAACEAMIAAIASDDRAALAAAFATAPRRSIDFAVLERADRVVVVAADIAWNDVGSFPALAAVQPRDAAGNAFLGTHGAACIALDSRDNVVYGEGARTVALFGVEGLVVVAVGDAVLVCPKDRAADLKTLVDHLRATGRTDLL